MNGLGSVSGRKKASREDGVDVANHVRTKLQEVGLLPTRTRIALGSLLFANGARHVTAENLLDEARQARVQVSLATIYNTLRQFTEVGFLRQVPIDSSKLYFDTNNAEHHHFYVEDRQELIDISAADMVVGRTPVPPSGYEIAHIDIVVRLRRKLASQKV